MRGMIKGPRNVQLDVLLGRASGENIVRMVLTSYDVHVENFSFFSLRIPSRDIACS